MDYVKFIYRPLAARAARQVLVGRNRARQSPDRGRFTRADVDSLLEAAWLRYTENVGKLPVEPTIGSRMNVRPACFTMSFFNTLLAIDTERGYSIERVADAAWRVYRLWSTVALGLAYLTLGKKTSLAFAVGSDDDHHSKVSLRFPFDAQGYLLEIVTAESGTVFDVVRYPIADFSVARGPMMVTLFMRDRGLLRSSRSSPFP